MTPLEFGSWDPQLSAMVNMSYAGTHLSNGQPDNTTSCTTFFDQIGFIMGTSSSLFNVSVFILGHPSLRSLMIRAYGHQQIFDHIHNLVGFDKSSSKAILLLVDRMLQAFRTRADDVANWPNVCSFSRS